MKWPGLVRAKFSRPTRPSSTGLLSRDVGLPIGGRELAPFLLCGLLELITVLLPPHAASARSLLLVLAISFVVCVVAVATRYGGPIWLQDLTPIGGFLVAAELRDATGGAASSTTPMLILPVLGIALYGTWRQLWIVAVATGVMLLGPLVVINNAKYPLTEWRAALLWTAIAAGIGPVVHSIVRSLHDREAERAMTAAHLEGILHAASQHAIIAVDNDGIITTWSRGAERLFGYRPDEVLGLPTPPSMHDPDEIQARAAELGIPVNYEVFLGAARSGLDESREWTFTAKSGARIPVRLHLSALRGPDDEVLGFIGVSTDITAERNALELARAGEQRWRTLLDHLPDLCVLVIDSDLRYQVAVGAGLTRLGLREVAGKTLDQVAPPGAVEMLEPIFRVGLAGGEASCEAEVSGSERILYVTAVPLPTSGKPEALIVATDVTEARMRESALLAAERRFHQLFDEAPHGIMLLDCDGLIIEINPAMCALHGRSADSVLGQPFHVLGGEAREGSALVGLLTADPSGRIATDNRIIHPDGRIVDIAASASLIRDAAGQVSSVIIYAVDVSERRRYEEQLAHLADHDPLTGLANRRRFGADLTSHLLGCSRTGAVGAMLMLDLDHFKNVNDSYGHSAGDDLICAIADLLRRRLRRTDVVARLGGDEFAILLPDSDRESAELVAGGIVELVRQYAATGPLAFRSVTCSVGLVMIDYDEITPEHLTMSADIAMYKAKQAGRDCYVVLDGEDAAA